MPRRKDYVWLGGMTIILGGFGTIAIIGYLSPIVDLSKLDGRCRIGLPPKVSFPLLSFDVGVNFLLTGLFFWLLRPVLDLHSVFNVSSQLSSVFTRVAKNNTREREEAEHETDGGTLRNAMNKNIKTLLWKCLIGSTLVMLPTVGNMAQFYIMDGRELGWICLTICTLDSKLRLKHHVWYRQLTTTVSWCVVIVNWLTIGSAEAERNLTTLMTQRSKARRSVPPEDNGLNSTVVSEAPIHFKTVSLKDEGGLLRDLQLQELEKSKVVRDVMFLRTESNDAILRSGSTIRPTSA